jgi:hypothetical protein
MNYGHIYCCEGIERDLASEPSLRPVNNNDNASGNNDAMDDGLLYYTDLRLGGTVRLVSTGLIIHSSACI